MFFEVITSLLIGAGIVIGRFLGCKFIKSDGGLIFTCMTFTVLGLLSTQLVQVSARQTVLMMSLFVPTYFLGRLDQKNHG
jgi:hypothetical protein